MNYMQPLPMYMDNYNDLQQMRDRIDMQMRNMQAPVQNIINTNTKVDLEARFLNENENVSDIIINNRTLFIDEKNSMIQIKELDGSISKTYQILIPKDPKDQKIDELESKLREMEMRFNEYAKYDKSINDEQEPNAGDNGDIKSSAKRNSK